MRLDNYDVINIIWCRWVVLNFCVPFETGFYLFPCNTTLCIKFLVNFVLLYELFVFVFYFSKPIKNSWDSRIYTSCFFSHQCSPVSWLLFHRNLICTLFLDNLNTSPSINHFLFRISWIMKLRIYLYNLFYSTFLNCSFLKMSFNTRKESTNSMVHLLNSVSCYHGIFIRIISTLAYMVFNFLEIWFYYHYSSMY